MAATYKERLGSVIQFPGMAGLEECSYNTLDRIIKCTAKCSYTNWYCEGICLLSDKGLRDEA